MTLNVKQQDAANVVWAAEAAEVGVTGSRGAQRPECRRLAKPKCRGISVTESPIQSPAQSPRSSVGGLDLDEYEQWQRDIEDADASVTDPYEYCHIRRLKYPRLSRMALDLLTVPPMSAECERLFSTTGRMVTKSRNRLDASTIGLCQTLRSWLRAGLIGSLDRILMDE
ncbi:hypothetical protein FOFC_18025 [Fusarium oxysporum]|nr:hypothetical protein FOFC_18025 [Fusarium oxysporum]